MHLATQGGGGSAWIPSMVGFIDGRNFIETARHSLKCKLELTPQKITYLFVERFSTKCHPSFFSPISAMTSPSPNDNCVSVPA